LFENFSCLCHNSAVGKSLVVVHTNERSYGVPPVQKVSGALVIAINQLYRITAGGHYACMVSPYCIRTSIKIILSSQEFFVPK
jgi:hypothetical protein